MNGYEWLSTEDKKLCPVIAVTAVTASRDDKENQCLTDLGAIAVCEKPYNSDKIKQLVQFHLHKHDNASANRLI